MKVTASCYSAIQWDVTATFMPTGMPKEAIGQQQKKLVMGEQAHGSNPMAYHPTKDESLQRI